MMKSGIYQATYHIMAECYRMLGRIPDSIKWLNAGILYDPEYRDDYMILADIYTAMGMYEMSYAVVKEGLVKSKRKYSWEEWGNFWNEIPEYILAIDCLNLDRIDEGIQHIKSAMQFAPDNQGIKDTYIKLLEKKAAV